MALYARTIPYFVGNATGCTACWPMKPVAITSVDPFGVLPKVVTWRSET